MGLAYPGISGGFAETTLPVRATTQRGLTAAILRFRMPVLPTDGDITLRLTVFSGDPVDPGPKPFTKRPFHLEDSSRFPPFFDPALCRSSNGFVQVDRIRGSAPYYAYAVINDQSSADGSFIAPSPGKLAGGTEPVNVACHRRDQHF